MLTAETRQLLRAMRPVSLLALRELLESLSVTLPVGALVRLGVLLDLADFARWRQWLPDLET
jgi:hypothetical protein